MKKINKLININENPFVLFKKWFEQAKRKEENNPNAMNLATVGKNFQPNSRMVLLKSYDKSGFIFYTNLDSKKANTIKENENVALNFYWKSLLRQIRIEGVAKLISNKKADIYYKSRSLNSRIGAWASDQSLELSSRDELESRFRYFKKKFKAKKIPRPLHWSGYKVESNLIEFWQEMPHRLHDRVEFIKTNNKWTGKRLFP